MVQRVYGRHRLMQRGGAYAHDPSRTPCARARPPSQCRRTRGWRSLNRLAFSATVHCLTGCAIGEVLGMIVGTAFGWGGLRDNCPGGGSRLLVRLWPHDDPTGPGVTSKDRSYLALLSDTASITLMEFVDNATMLVIPGAMDAGLTEPLFWGSLAFALAVAGLAAFPLNHWLIARGRGHAVVHAYHGH